MNQPIKEIRRRWSAHQDRLLEAVLKDRAACVASAWCTPDQMYESALRGLRAQAARIQERLAEGLGTPSLPEPDRALLTTHQERLQRLMANVPERENLKILREHKGDRVGEVLRREPRPSEKGPGEVLLRVDLSLTVEVTEELEFLLGGKVERPMSKKEAASLALPLDDFYEQRVSQFLRWRVAQFHDPIAVRTTSTKATWRLLILPPSTTGPQMLERVEELRAAVRASSIGKDVDRCGIVTDDARHCRIAHEQGFLGYVPEIS